VELTFALAYILAGLTVFGVLKLLKDKDKSDYEDAYKKFNSFLDS